MTGQQQLELSVVMPVYNEEGCIREVILSWGNFLNIYFNNNYFKIILINDGSKDNTKAVLDELSGSLPYLHVVDQKNGGHGKAVLNGYREAVKLGSAWVFQVDSDNQFLPEDFPKLWENRDKSNFILGYRKKRYDEADRLIITRIVIALNAFFFGVYIRDSNIPYRLIKGSYLPELLKALPGEPFAPNIFLSVIAKRDGNNLMNIPVTHKERITGQVSIIKIGLLKACYRTAKELFVFSLMRKKPTR